MTTHPLPLSGGAAIGTGWHWLTLAVEMAAAAGGNWPPDPATPGLACLPRVATRTPGVDARPVRAARDFTIATLRGGGAAADRSDDMATVVSELLLPTRAARAARSRRNPASIADPARPATALRPMRGRRLQPTGPRC